MVTSPDQGEPCGRGTARDYFLSFNSLMHYGSPVQGYKGRAVSDVTPTMFNPSNYMQKTVLPDQNKLPGLYKTTTREIADQYAFK